MLNTLQASPVRTNAKNEQGESDRVRHAEHRFAEMMNERRAGFLLVFFGALMALIACWNLPHEEGASRRRSTKGENGRRAADIAA
jgi:hypothetical protein